MNFVTTAPKSLFLHLKMLGKSLDICRPVVFRRMDNHNPPGPNLPVLPSQEKASTCARRRFR